MSTDAERLVRAALADTAAGITGESPDPSQFRCRTTVSRRPVLGRRVWLPALATAAAVAVVSTGTVLFIRDNGSGSHPAAPGAGVTSPAMSPTESAPQTHGPSTVSSPAQPAGCVAGHLAPSLDTDRTGPANGTENVIILLRNTGSQPCWLGGLVTLNGVAIDGSVARLGFQGSLDPGYANPSPAAGPGAVNAGGLGALHLSLAINNCSKPVVRYTKLRIQFASGSRVDMPYPSQLTVSGCFGYAAQPGPIPGQ